MRKLLFVSLLLALFIVAPSIQACPNGPGTCCETCAAPVIDGPNPYSIYPGDDKYTYTIGRYCQPYDDNWGAPSASGGVFCDGDSLTVYNHYPTAEEIASVQCHYTYNCIEDPPCSPNCGNDDGDNCGGQCSPIVLNLGNGAFRFSGADDPVLFDLDIDGKPDRLTWTARGSEIAFLAIDHNLDGVIASGAELFGNRPGSFANGFETLKVYDSNHDDLIDHNDSVWPFLRLWTDVSHDGVSQAGELQTLDAAGVQGLSLAYHETARADRNGNEFRQQAIYWRNGQARPYYDVWLARVP